MYLPPACVAANADTIASTSPTGTGQNDYAFVRITGTTDPNGTLPASFPALPMTSGDPYTGQQMVLAAYPAGFLGGISITLNLYTTSAANVNRPMWSEAYGQLDGSIFYDITPKFKIGIQGTNLGREIAYTRVSSDLTRPLDTQYYSATKTDRRISVVLRGSF